MNENGPSEMGDSVNAPVTERKRRKGYRFHVLAGASEEKMAVQPLYVFIEGVLYVTKPNDWRHDELRAYAWSCHTDLEISGFLQPLDVIGVEGDALLVIGASARVDMEHLEIAFPEEGELSRRSGYTRFYVMNGYDAQSFVRRVGEDAKKLLQEELKRPEPDLPRAMAAARLQLLYAGQEDIFFRQIRFMQVNALARRGESEKMECDISMCAALAGVSPEAVRACLDSLK